MVKNNSDKIVNELHPLTDCDNLNNSKDVERQKTNNRNSYNVTSSVAKNNRNTRSRKERLIAKANQYSNNFTLHAVSKICNGNWCEKFVWIIIFLACVGLAGYASYSIYNQYLDQDVYLVTETAVTNKNTFPAVTFCIERNEKTYYCGFDINARMPFYLDPNEPCPRTNDETPIREYISRSGSRYWSNNIFEFSCPRTSRCTYEDINRKFFKTSNNVRGSCVTWNPNGTYYNDEAEIDLVVAVLNSKFDSQFQHIEIIIHDKGHDGVFVEKSIRLTPGMNIDIYITKKIIKRLETTYSTKCVKSNSRNIFPGKYSINNCVESHKCIKIYKQCGDIYDHCRKYIPHKIVQQYLRPNITVENVTECLKASNKSVDISNCARPCEETIYDATALSKRSSAVRAQARVSLKYKDKYTYRIEREVVSKTFFDVLSKISGLVAFLVGASVIFVFEFLAYIFIVTLKLCA
ncbi:amiloride-sensitive sodium channel subunit alpha-like [Hydractinia symbiolongicarpus]|uniref:amiloride-sensitive sodium channel subunit alpha-like n=1 Tax=Hydractinia symbiolongicarpus TaxID=13093 RepID=UPI00254FB400|nr:amiloride-sensitive sodium channel subunit alpha-like [Hydractinia symbiolongicarpus]